MNSTRFSLRFTVANRTLVSWPLRIIHLSAFELDKGHLANQLLPQHWPTSTDGFLLHGVPATDQPPTLQRTAHGLCYHLPSYTHYRTDLRSSFEDFLQLKSSKTRSTLRRKVRKFVEASISNEIDCREYHSPEAVDEFFRLAGPLAQRTYQAQLFDGALPLDTAFRSSAKALASMGALRCYLLFMDDVPAAYLYAPLQERTAIYAYLGYDKQLSRLSPGTVLQYLVHERLFSDPEVDWFDFTEGEGAHKALFASEQYERRNQLYLRDSWYYRVLLWAHYRWDQLVERIKRWRRRP
ncbi:GNAT family N-acetyltransferase [Parahaliea mediterranea]|uniref:GNAT family N-acetyltransferase n=1 Tax=Parahaliea mediterranea TaxID=651086 RepID=UPI000E2F231E|nr:GNAT family N-acetyltransferase [Parahaliea mediterranea]